MKKLLLFFSLVLLATVGGCMVEKTLEIEYKSITQIEAKNIMDNTTGYVVLDVRTAQEYNTGHIVNAINIPNEVIYEQVESMLTDKEQVILVYCRSGRRSKEAASKLVELGYVNVLEFGGIIDWKYEIE